MAYKKLIKVSNVCQVLDKRKYLASQTINGVTFTNNGDGTITVNGTATGRTVFRFVFDRVIISKGAKLRFNNALDVEAYNKFWVEVKLQYTDGTDKYITDVSITPSPPIKDVNEITGYIIVNDGETVNETLTPQLFYLTEMYGAGNEPTTVEQFRQDFPEEMYDYSPHCWLTSYKRVFTCKTKNLLSFPYYGQYETKQGITFSKVSTYKVNASGINTGSTGCTFDFNYNKVFKAGTYTIKFYTEGSVPPELYYRIRKDSYYGGTIIIDKEFQKTFTLSEDTVLFISFGIYGTMSPQYTGKKINVNVWCQIEKGNTATDYVPYGIIPSYQRNLTCKTKNLFDISKVTETDTLKVKGNSIYSYHYPAILSDTDTLSIFKSLKPNTNYTISAVCPYYLGNATNSIRLVFNNFSNFSLFDSHNSGFAQNTFSLTQEQIDNINFVYFYGRVESEGGPIIWSNIQIEEGDTATPYVPYGYL